MQEIQPFQGQSLPSQGFQGIKEGQTLNFVQPIPGTPNLQAVPQGVINLQPIASGQLIHPLAPCQINQPIKGAQNLVAVQPVTMIASTAVRIFEILRFY